MGAHQPNHHSLQSALLFAHTFMTKIVIRKNLQKWEKTKKGTKYKQNLSFSHGKKEGFVRQRDRQDES